MSAHTPGPWIVVDMGGGSHPFYVRHEYRRGGGPNLHGSAGAVAKLPSSKFHNAAANARLIAAAPDGLIAGTDLLDVVKAAIRAGDWKVDGACDPDAAIRRMEQFIAKATGEQP